MQRILLPIAVVLIVGFGVWEGLWTDRWSMSQDLPAAADKLGKVPLNIGDWVGQDHELDQRQVVRAEMTGYLLRHYTNKNTGATLQVLLVCGRAGPTSLHPPDVCYQGAGYQLDAPQARKTVNLPSPQAPADFWVGRFQKNGASPEPLRIYWSWNAEGKWVASDNPRWTFGGFPFLYKLYVIRAMPKVDEQLVEDPTAEFLRQLLPKLRESLFPEVDRRATSALRLIREELSVGRSS